MVLDRAVPRTSLRAAPTPIFAFWRGLNLYLPVPPSQLTEIGFHQAAYTYALHMQTKLRTADMTGVRGKGTGRVQSETVGPDGRLNVLVLRMWRPRPGKPDSAADVGAMPGVSVISPVTGTVVKVKSYKLYGKCARL